MEFFKNTFNLLLTTHVYTQNVMDLDGKSDGDGCYSLWNTELIFYTCIAVVHKIFGPVRLGDSAEVRGHSPTNSGRDNLCGDWPLVNIVVVVVVVVVVVAMISLLLLSSSIIIIAILIVVVIVIAIIILVLLSLLLLSFSSSSSSLLLYCYHNHRHNHHFILIVFIDIRSVL